MTDLYAVVGHPISHSLSPLIHSAFAAQTGEAMEYTAIQAPLDQFEATVAGFFERGGRGLNVTVPFKGQAWKMAAKRAERAEKAGAANTLLLDSKGLLTADNTDGTGLVRDLTVYHGVDLTAARILVLGAGGAVRGVLSPLLACGPESITIANRTVEKARLLAELFADEGRLTACGFEQPAAPYDLIINGTSASLQGDLPPLSRTVVGPETRVYDMMYSATQTPFNQWAAGQGALATLDGLGMLVEQAAESFWLWRGVRPDTASVRALLRDRNG